MWAMFILNLFLYKRNSAEILVDFKKKKNLKLRAYVGIIQRCSNRIVRIVTLIIFAIFFFKLYVLKFRCNGAKIKAMFLCMFLMHDHYICQYLYCLHVINQQIRLSLYA
jgi:hypothetical protein